MSKIDELIAQHCPNGVEFKELGEVLDYEQPNKYNGLIIELQQTGESLPLNVINDLKTNEQIPPCGQKNNAKSMNGETLPCSRNDSAQCMNDESLPCSRNDGTKNGQIPPFSRNDDSPCGEMREGSGGFAATSFSTLKEPHVISSEARNLNNDTPVISSVARTLNNETPVIPNGTKCSEETVTKKTKNE